MILDEAGHVIIQRAFDRQWRDPQRLGIAPHEAHRDIRAAVAHHRFGQQRVKLIEVARQQLVMPIDKLVLKAFGGTQQTRLQQRHQVVQLVEVVLDGRGGEQQDVFLVQRADEFPQERRAIAAVVGFVDDDDVPLLFGNG